MFSTNGRVLCSGVLLPEQVLGGVADGSSSGRSSTHVGDRPQSVDGVVFGWMVSQAELQPLIIGELHCTWTATHSQSANQHVN